jgi:hypothetical protein
LPEPEFSYEIVVPEVGERGVGDRVRVRLRDRVEVRVIAKLG